VRKFLLKTWLIFTFFALITPAPVPAHAQEPEFAPFVVMAQKGQTEKAYQGLAAVADQKFAYEKLHVKYLALGNWASELKKWPEAREHLQKALKFGTQNAAHIYYLIGHTYKEQAEYQKAADAFNRALDHSPAQNITYQTRFELSEIALLSNKPGKAREHLQYLERRWRNTPNYPEILHRLVGVELKENRRHLACKWARKMYSRHPAHPLVKDWGVDLADSKYDDKKIGCLASSKEIRERMRRLQLSGQAAKAREEIDKLKARARPQEAAEVDMLLVSYLAMQGYPDEALQILIRYFDIKKTEMNYQTTLGQVAARAGEFQTAVGAYYKAYRLSPNSRHGRSALFTSAFLSYQIQDYDGAYRKFNDIAKKFAGSGLARDSKWHLAWIKYLKGDHLGAEKSLRALLTETYKQRRRQAVKPFANDRTRYWLAMSLVKQEKHSEAREILEPLAADKSMSFYSLVATQRLAQLPAPPQKQRSLATDSLAADRENELAEATNVAPPTLLFSPNGEREVVPEDAESEENVQSTLESEDNDDASSDANAGEVATGPEIVGPAPEGTTVEGEDPELISVTTFRDPRLRARFQRAHNLMAIGLYDWAKWELFEIERRTSNRAYLRSLMEAYAKIGSYNRVAYISEINFAAERARLGFKEGYDLWAYSHPNAYNDDISRYSKKFNTSEALVLAIMRAESHFNRDAISPVGARGLMQIMPYTADQLTRLLGEPKVSEADLLNPGTNIRLGTRYLSRLQKKFQEQVPLVAAGYNAGPHRVFSWLNTFGTLDMDEFIEHVPFVETRNYMKKVVRNYAIYNELYSSKKDTYVWLTQPVPMRVSSRPSPRENWDLID